MSGQEVPERAITVSFQLHSGGFGQGGQDTVTLEGLRVLCQIGVQGNESGTVANARIEGMPYSLMNRLTVASPGGFASTTANLMTVRAGDVGSTLAQVFSGWIGEAYVDFTQAPEVAFVVTAYGNALYAAQPISPTSFSGPIPAVTVLQAIAAKCGLTFANYGVTAVLTNPYYWGTGRDQIVDVCRAIGAEWNINGENSDGKGSGIGLEVFAGATGKTASLPIISAATGLIGYPNYSPNGVELATLFNPQLGFRQTFKLQSLYSPAAWAAREIAAGAPPSNGQWIVLNLDHEIASATPDGPWFTHVEAMVPAFAAQTVA